MTPHETAMYLGGFAAYADGVARELIISLPIDSESKGWALRGWDASKADNESLARQSRRNGT
jgi:hypothetical protein